MVNAADLFRILQVQIVEVARNKDDKGTNHEKGLINGLNGVLSTTKSGGG